MRGVLGWLVSLSVLVVSCLTSVDAMAGVVGLASQYRTVGDKRVVDVWMVVSSSSDKFSGVSGVNLSTNATGGFYQALGMYNKTWKPDAANFASTRSSIDSFVTAGTFSGGAVDGEFYASEHTRPNSGFTGNSYNATPASSPANTMPVNAGWYTVDTTSADSTTVENLTGYSNLVYSSTAAQNAAKGYWIAHLVMQDKSDLQGSMTATLDSLNPASQLTVTNFDLFNSPSSGGAVPEPASAITLGVLSLIFARKQYRANQRNKNRSS